MVMFKPRVMTGLLVVLAMTQPTMARPKPPEKPIETETIPTPASPPKSGTPDSTIETFADWQVICNEHVGSPPAKVCEIDQAIAARGQTAPIARIAFGRPNKDAPMRMVIVVPANVSILPGVVLELTSLSTTLNLKYRACSPNGCVSDMDLATDQLENLRKHNEAAAQLTFTDSTMKAHSLSVSLRGFNDAFSSLLAR